MYIYLPANHQRYENSENSWYQSFFDFFNEKTPLKYLDSLTLITLIYRFLVDPALCATNVAL